MISGLAELRQRIAVKTAPSREGDCVVFAGAHSQSGGRGVFYPAHRVGDHVYRIARLLLLFDELPRTSPLSLADAIAKASQVRRGYDASHACDNALCVRRSHLKWERHADNVRHQAVRRRRAELAERGDL